MAEEFTDDELRGIDEAVQGIIESRDHKQSRTVCDDGKARTLNEAPPALSIVKADELTQMKLEKPFFIVKDILPVGLTIVASPPKYGKSWLMLDLCSSAAAGVPFLGRATNQCDTLYLALEDSEVRLQSRLKKILDGRPAPPGFGMTTHALDIEHGLIQQLTDEIEKDPGLKLIVIDTFQKVRAGSKKNETDYAADYREVGVIKELADKYGLGIVLVTHVRKMKDPTDPFANVSGTSGITGAADTMIVMNKEKRTDENTQISVTGRDVEMNEWMATFDKVTCRWKLLGTVEELEDRFALTAYNADPIISTIRMLLHEHPDGWTGTAGDIISASRHDPDSKGPIRVQAQKLGRSIAALRDQMYDNDNILYDTIKNGTGAVKHHFEYDVNPFKSVDSR